MNPLLRLLGAAASHGLLTGQIVFSAAFVGACELPNWIHAPRQVNACLDRCMTVSALFFPSGMQTAVGSKQPDPAVEGAATGKANHQNGSYSAHRFVIGRQRACCYWVYRRS